MYNNFITNIGLLLIKAAQWNFRSIIFFAVEFGDKVFGG